MIATIDGSSIERFVFDIKAFNKFTDQRFTLLDINRTGALSRSDFKSGGYYLKSIAPDYDEENVNDLVFVKHDADKSNTIDREEFRQFLREILLAIAKGIGGTPINVLVEEDGMLLKVYEHELDWIKRERNEKVNNVLVEDRDGVRLGNGGVVKTKKRKNSKFLAAFCACGGNQ